MRERDLLRMRRSHKSLILLLPTAIAACASAPEDRDVKVPEIVEVFACSDYCPGPEERYLKLVYDGITEEEDCRKLGGKLYTVIGWGQRTVCEVR